MTFTIEYALHYGFDWFTGRWGLGILLAPGRGSTIGMMVLPFLA